jgi:hypothetical protein
VARGRYGSPRDDDAASAHSLGSQFLHRRGGGRGRKRQRMARTSRNERRGVGAAWGSVAGAIPARLSTCGSPGRSSMPRTTSRLSPISIRCVSVDVAMNAVVHSSSTPDKTSPHRNTSVRGSPGDESTKSFEQSVLTSGCRSSWPRTGNSRATPTRCRSVVRRQCARRYALGQGERRSPPLKLGVIGRIVAAAMTPARGPRTLARFTDWIVASRRQIHPPIRLCCKGLLLYAGDGLSDRHGRFVRPPSTRDLISRSHAASRVRFSRA